VEEEVVNHDPREALAALLLLAALGGAAGCGGGARELPPPARADAREIQARLAAERGHPVLLSFWATWCRPCVEEFPALTALHRDRPGGLRVVAVSLDGFLSGDEEAPRVVNEFLRATPAALDHLVYSGSQDALFGTFDLPGSIPYAILFDAAGGEIGRFEGIASEREIRALLDAPAGAGNVGSGSDIEKL
jgi:thiol-disulfide isomerase/thioredoxin